MKSLPGKSSLLNPAQQAGGFVLLSVLALLGNYFSLSIGFNVDFIFGSVAGLIAVVLLGPALGTAVSTIGAGYTFVLWNHPYAIIIFGLEALWVGLVRKRKPTAPLFMVDLLYWVIIGIPLVFVFYYGVMDLNMRGAAIIAMKQSLNGISNTILASIIIGYAVLRKWLRLPLGSVRKNAYIIFESMAFLLLIPCIGGLIYMNQRDVAEAQSNLAKRLQQSNYEANWLVGEWLDRHGNAVEQLAIEGSHLGFASSDELQRIVVETHRLFPSFHNMFIGDPGATTLAFDPLINERGESTIGINFVDRQWFKRLKTTKRLVISDVFTGRGGIFEPIISISYPIVKEDRMTGFALGAVNLDQMHSFIDNLAKQSGLDFTLLDRSDNIVIATNGERKPLDHFNLGTLAGSSQLINNVFLNLPKSEKNVTPMQAWKTATLYTQTKIEQTGWTILSEGSLAPVQQSVYNSSIMNMAVIYLLLLVTSGVSALVSRFLSQPLHQLARVSADIPEKIESGSQIDWPVARSQEVADMVEHFKVTATELQSKIQALREHSENLEATVAERTAELQQSMDESERTKTLLQAILDSAPVAVAWADEEMNTEYLNRRFTELTGYDIEDIPTLETWSEKAYPDPEYRKEISEFRQQVLVSEQGTSTSEKFEAWINCKDGKKVCCLCFTTNIMDGKYLAILSDITDRKISEEQLDSYARSLNVLLQEVNHRVKNNLALLIGMLNLESRHRENEAYRDFIAEIVGRVHALSVVHSLLSSSAWRPINLRELSTKIVNGALTGTHKGKVEISATDLTIEASQAHNLALVLNELTTNSIKYAGADKPVEIAVTIEADDDEIALVFHDNGQGYPQKILDDGGKSAGIGLRMIRGIVEMSLYGNILFRNDNGAVTEIRFKKDFGEETENA
ncbi:MAG: hypothetical protein C0615_01445 [Desulfuromonas sp.]|nr:MAG: hypothetical protein C0615_01445 [Desulfuromonas sp.]